MVRRISFGRTLGVTGDDLIIDGVAGGRKITGIFEQFKIAVKVIIENDAKGVYWRNGCVEVTLTFIG